MQALWTIWFMIPNANLPNIRISLLVILPDYSLQYLYLAEFSGFEKPAPIRSLLHLSPYLRTMQSPTHLITLLIFFIPNMYNPGVDSIKHLLHSLDSELSLHAISGRQGYDVELSLFNPYLTWHYNLSSTAWMVNRTFFKVQTKQIPVVFLHYIR